jgi:hypothetical protein
MKLRLTKSWYDKRVKAEENCLDVAAGESVSLNVLNKEKKSYRTAARKMETPATTSTRTRKADKDR